MVVSPYYIGSNQSIIYRTFVIRTSASSSNHQYKEPEFSKQEGTSMKQEKVHRVTYTVYRGKYTLADVKVYHKNYTLSDLSLDNF